MQDPDETPQSKIARLEREIAALNKGLAAVLYGQQELVRLIHEQHPVEVERLEEQLRHYWTEARVDPSFSQDKEFWRQVRKPFARALGMPDA